MKRPFAAILMGMLCAIFVAGSAYSATLSVQTSASTVSVGQNFALNVEVLGVTDLHGFQFDIAFDPAILSVASVIEGSFLSTAGTTFFFEGFIDNPGGSVSFVIDSLIGAIPGANGTGGLATINFTSLSIGSSSINIANVILLDSNLVDISSELVGGLVTVAG